MCIVGDSSTAVLCLNYVFPVIVWAGASSTYTQPFNNVFNFLWGFPVSIKAYDNNHNRLHTCKLYLIRESSIANCDRSSQCP